MTVPTGSLGTTTRGVWSRASALDVLTRGEVDGLVERGEWQRPWPAVYADGGFTLDVEQRALAAVMASGDVRPRRIAAPGTVRVPAAAVGRTAARLWRLPLVDDDDPATGAHEHLVDEVAVWRHLRPLHAGDAGLTRVLHRRRVSFKAGELGQLRSGLWLASPARTLLDLAGRVSDDALVCALDDALRRELVTAAELDDCIALHSGNRGTARLRRALALVDPRAESPGETLLRLVLGPVLPGLVPQVRVVRAHGRVVARLDLGDERLRLGVELDGKAGHAGSHMVAKDRRRDAATAALGWTTERFTWFDVRRRQADVRRTVLATARRLEAQHRPVA